MKEGWQVIQERGITKWGISNHYPTRSEYGNYIPSLRQEVDWLETDKILLGVEMELEHEDGTNEIPPDILKHLDFVIGSSHHQPMGFLNLPDITEDEIGEFFTSYRNVLINSFNKLQIDIWGHPFLQELQHFGDRFWNNYLKPLWYECLEVCADKHIAIELTPTYDNKCKKQPTTYPVLDEMYRIAMENSNIMFVTSSDSHSLAGLGDIRIPMDYVKKFNIPDSRLLELHKK